MFVIFKNNKSEGISKFCSKNCFFLLNFAKIAFMRIDKFLNVVNITKRRAISEDMCKSGVVGINGVIVKASKEVKVGDIISLHFTQYTQEYKVLALPNTKSISKNAQNDYVVKL